MDAHATDTASADALAGLYAELRPLVFSIAYRMLGSVAEADDVVQEAFLRYQRARADGADVASPRAYLSAVATRLCIDQLRSARARREEYVGQWLPEPLITDEFAPDGARLAEQADTLSLAFLVVLETLAPLERAVFLLREVFDYGYREIAEVVGRSEEYCRQLALRARRRVDERRPRFEASRRARDELAARFFAAVAAGDAGGLAELLAGDVVVYGDGGGRAPSWPQPIHGRERVARLLAGIARQGAEVGLTLRRHEVNGQPGAVFADAEGRLVSVLALDIADGQVQAVRSIINPDKLGHLGPVVADVRALARDRRR